jgi:hypothetical protein
MINQYLRLNDTTLNIQKAQNLMAVIETKRKDPNLEKELQKESSLFSELFDAFKNFFLNLGKPTIKKKLQKKGSPAKSSDYNDFMVSLNNDINLAYKQTDNISSVIVKDYNYSEADRQMLKNKISSIASNLTDYSFYSNGAKSQSIFAIDDFTDNTKIDFTKMSAGSNSAEVVTNEGIVTLKRTGNIDRSSLVNRVTGVKESIPKWDPVSQTGGYEGLYFGVKGEPRPEGQKWHVQFSANGTTMYEMGASEAELMPRRLQLFDNNPDTFWEVELNTSPVVGYMDKTSGKQISVEEFNQLAANELSSPNVNTSGGTIVTSNTGSLIENYVPVSSAGSTTYLNCSFIAHLKSPSILNWISLNPNNFGESNYFDVLSIQTSADGQKFDELEGFEDHEYAIELTEQANSELNPQQIKNTLSPDQFKYAGMGVWSFAPRTARMIKFDLRQSRSYLKDYSVLMVTVSQTITTVTTKKSWFSKKVSTDTKTITKDIEIPYLVGMISGFDVLSLDEASFASNTKTPLSGGGAIAGAVVGANIGAMVTLAVGGADLGLSMVVGAVIGFVAGLFGSKKTVDVQASPQTITKQWTVTKNDRARFAIGIRDINLYSYTFAESSEFVSVPYLSPKPISKLALKVDETIPTNFYNTASTSNTENNWLRYYISVDDGTSWSRISPMTHRTSYEEDGKTVIPEIININSDIPLAERSNPSAYIDTVTDVYNVRFKAVLSRPTDISNAESYTPILAKYALQIFPVGGL